MSLTSPTPFTSSHVADSLTSSLQALAAVPASTFANFVCQRRYGGKLYWYIEFLHPFPDRCPTKDRRVRKRAKNQTRHGAEAEARQVWHQCHLDVGLALAPATPRLSEFIIQWWSRHVADCTKGRPLSGQTIRTYYSYLREYIIPRLGDFRFNDLTELVLKDFLSSLRADGLGGKYVSNIRGLVSVILNCAFKWRVIPHPIPVPPAEIPERIFDFLRFHEKTRFLDAAENDHLAFLFALETGVRPGELVAVQGADIHLEAKKVVISRNFSKYTDVVAHDLLTGPGAVPPSWGIKTTKNGTQRDIPLTDTLQVALKGLRSTNELLFPHLRLETLSGRVQAAMARAGLSVRADGSPRSLRAYDLRHTFATLLAMKGVPLHFISDWMGHSSVTVTEMYAHYRSSPDAPGAGSFGDQAAMMSRAFGE